jgi:chromosome partitioning protein
VFRTIVPRNVRLSEAPSHGEPICMYDPSCLGAKSYDALAKEFLDREGSASSSGSTVGGARG